MQHKGIGYHYCLGRYQYGIKSFSTEQEMKDWIDTWADEPFIHLANSIK